jgi:hypothetical protein
MSIKFYEEYKADIDELSELYLKYAPAEKEFKEKYNSTIKRIEALKKRLKGAAADQGIEEVKTSKATILFESTTKSSIDPKEYLHFVKNQTGRTDDFWRSVSVNLGEAKKIFGELILEHEKVLKKEPKLADRVKILY